MPSIEAFAPSTLQRDWGEEIIIAETAQYLGKILRMRSGTKGGLQKHVEKDETFFLFSGCAWVRHDDGTGVLTQTLMHAGDSYHIPPGAVHQVEAIQDSVFFEASTPHHHDRVRMETAYGLLEDGGLPTTR